MILETRFGLVPIEHERPEPLKFAWPLILLPELFTGAIHLALARGYFASLGWEVYTPDLRVALQPRASARNSQAWGFAQLRAALLSVVEALEREVILLGHGIGGLLAIDAATDSQVKAAVALAPMLPGIRSPLLAGLANLRARRLGGKLKAPRGKVLMDLLADADPFQRETLARSLVADDSRPPSDVVRGRYEFTGGIAAPRLIVSGDSDPFAPLEMTSAFAARLGVTLRVVRGRGHWLIGGRALERTVGEVQRFLVRSLGSDLLLLYSEQWAAARDTDGEDK